ncbi:MAG: phosphonate C-P lyase system protein PhnH [Pseudomonadota bacterium]
MAPPDLSGAFDDRPRQAAASFRAMLRALSRPGRIESIDPVAPPHPLEAAAAALLLTLADATTPLWLPERLRGTDSAAWLLFHTNAPQTVDRAEAEFALGRWEELLPIEAWPQGEPQFPDRSTTLIVETAGLDGGATLTLSGPGIREAQSWSPLLPADAVPMLQANARKSPLGLDFFFTAGSRVAGLPRSIRIGG